MEYLNQMRESQKKIERLVMVFNTIFTLNLCVYGWNEQWAAWISGVMLATLAISWGVFIGEHKTYWSRVYITVLGMQITYILYATNTGDLYMPVTTFALMLVFVAFYGDPNLLRLAGASLVIVVFYHMVIAHTSGIMRLWPHVAVLVWMQFLMWFWVSQRSEVSERMVQIIDALMDAERSKDDFLANVSHEIRTPINTICGMSDMALREQDLGALRNEIYDIQASGRSLLSLVTDILDFSQLQSGRISLEEENYNISSTLNDVINMAMSKKMGKPIELIIDCDASLLCNLYGDEKKIRRVIMKLIDNAIKFTNEGCVTIAVEGRRESYGLNLIVAVRDTGIGINDENREKLFHSFSQVDTKWNRQQGGIGLGLAISKELVKKMGGTITVKSRVGKGSEIKFVIPQKISEDVPIVHIENREALNVGVYIDMEQFTMTEIRDEYQNVIVHISEQLHVRNHICRSLAELKRREGREPFSHIFISLTEYREDPAYFDRLSEETKVVLVLEQSDERYMENYRLLRLYKPFYIIPVVSILNGSREFGGGLQMVRHGKFIAPSAKILIVDDNMMNIRVAEGFLREYQIQVVHAESGAEALKTIESMDYDFVFMDHMMPEMDGVETMHRIREKVGEYYSNVPVIALTANAAPGSREMFLEEGFADFVAKPIEISVLERVLKRNLPEGKIIYLSGGDVSKAGSSAALVGKGRGRAVLSFENVSKQRQGEPSAGMSRNMRDAGELPADRSGNMRDAGELPADRSGNMSDAGGPSADMGGNMRDAGELSAGMSRNMYDAGGPSADRSGSGTHWGGPDLAIPEKARLSVGDLDVSRGLVYCGSKEAYLEILQACCESAAENARQITEYYESGDWKNYTIQVHALKSSMMSIGAMELSDRAKALESAGKTGDIKTIRAGQDELMREYRREMDQIAVSPAVYPAEPYQICWNRKAEDDVQQEEGRISGDEAEASELPDISEEEFDSLQEKFEDAMYGLDGDGMEEILRELGRYQYHGVPLELRLQALHKKIEMSDLMSAGDDLSDIRREAKGDMTGA